MFTQPRGTKTIYGEKLWKKNWLQQELSHWAQCYNFLEIETPTFEHSHLFIEESTSSQNILEKELFYLEGRKYALKPEGTASIARVVFTEKLLHKNPLPLKFFYFSQCFRYERPQKGRFREFTQFGLEIINAHSKWHEIELLIALDSLFRKKFNLELDLKINYLSNSKTKKEWSAELTKHFYPYSELLSECSRERIVDNPIRILDDKRDSQIEIVQNAPKISNLHNAEEKKSSEEIRNQLNKLGMQYTWDDSLVRGLDYYTGLVFEWSYRGMAVAGGGRYDELFQRFGQDSDLIPSVGFAIGLERFQELLDEQSFKWPCFKKIKIYLCYLLEELDLEVLLFIKELREYGIIVETNWDLKDLKAHFRRAEKNDIQWLLIYGQIERENREIILKQQFKNCKIHFSLNNTAALVREIETITFQEY